MKTLKFALLLVLCMLVLAACAPQGFVSLPDDVVSGINVVTVLLVGYGFAYLITLLPFLAFLEQFKLPLAAAVSAQLIQVLQVAIPDQYGTVVIHVLRAVLALIALFTAAKQLQRQGVI